ncbi:hypothetical protein BAUCODRAFT_566686 [Baudoinia panamericana UAMH 10762]|uniref:Peroxin 20 n=1 Tax=Baudoinia panamericana (strain UAMH 10762) TaxID=717646 RepID=M2M1I5_BAUPA|nr:uncharacterized protein BAUCODRAFT_566686 [Baudoinia panamericana UAMH 10762]EMD00913.1 hypothetical protein BAUCODRAFT_566686 [Baudoinia panamericana UAMH 10762]
MSEALCGPSNPLQQFKQQTSLDRTLQQDRLLSHRSPAYGFRSPDPNAGVLDAEFEAFQAGVPLSDLPQLQSFHRQQPDFTGPAQTPSWAADFQRMHIAPPPMQQQHLQQAAPSTAGWAQGFRNHIDQYAPRAQQSAPVSPLAFQQRARFGYSGFQNDLAQTTPFQATQQSKGKEPVYEQFDEAAFERAFDLARDDVELNFGAESVMMGSSQSEVLEADDTRLVRDETSRPDLGRDQLPDGLGHYHNDVPYALEQQDHSEKTEQPSPYQDDDALAATAQELLEKVEHNTTDKFRNSQFLGLMRKLRDREMRVEGDKMVETNVSTGSSLPKPPLTHSPHDSGYVSGSSSPLSLDSYHFDTHICKIPGCDVDHTFDHWESPAASTASPESVLKGTSTLTPLFDNTEQRPSPLALPTASEAAVDTRPPDYGIPAHEQDADPGRIHPADGQAVVDLLNDRAADIGTWPDDTLSDSAPHSPLEDGRPPFYGDLRALHGERSVNSDLSDMLYGHDGSLEAPVRWVKEPVYGSSKE